VAEARWHGVVPSTVTPFDADGAVDLDALARLVDFAVSVGAHGIAVTALAGEARLLTRDERREIVATAVAGVAGRVPVLVGVGAAAVDDARRLVLDADAEGADGVVLPLPDARPPGWGVVDALLEIAQASEVPVMVQDAPRYLDRAIGVEDLATVIERAQNVCSVKIEGAFDHVSTVIAALGETTDIWGGDGGRDLLACLDAGAVGVMPGIEVVDELVAIAGARDRGAVDDAAARMEAIRPLLACEMRSLEAYVASAKALLEARGLLAGTRTRLGIELGRDEHADLLGLVPSGIIEGVRAHPAQRA